MATYDPLGLISPALLSARQFGQRIVKHSWNEKLEPEMEDEWNKIVGEVVDRDVEVKRRCRVEQNSELHVCCDPSGDGYGAAVYLCTPGEAPKTTLFFAKSRVTPTTETKKAEVPKKKISIPRMELLAAQLGAKYCNYVRKELGGTFTKAILWTDNLPVLSQLLNPEERHDQFVQGRLETIVKQEMEEFRYVPTAENPADIASRGCTMDELKKNPLWWKGPPWLQEDQTTWPPVPDGYRTRPLPGEAVIVYPVIEGEQREVIETTRFSNLRKLIGTTQRLQFIRMCAKRSGVKLTTLGSEGPEDANEDQERLETHYSR